jgi:NTP pyrophosphatase (non-canonical NTP hydrolase)
MVYSRRGSKNRDVWTGERDDINTIILFTERWPSGWRRTLGKRVCEQLQRGFESHLFRHFSSKRQRIFLLFYFVAFSTFSHLRMYENIGKLLEFIKEKYEFNAANAEIICNGEKRKNWNTSEMYVKHLKKELEEMQEEMKQNNTPYLEDELWDILWDFLNLAYTLKLEGLIESEEHIFKRCEKKFEQRISAIKNGISWEDIKKKQKEELKNEYNKKYISN